MKIVKCLMLFFVLSASLGFVEPFHPLSPSVPILSDTEPPSVSAPDCRIQTC